MNVISPATAEEVREAVEWALGSETALEIVGRGTKRGLGRPVAAGATLDLSRLEGVIFYEPEELVIQVRAGTGLADVEALLRQHGQRLAFEPPDFGPLYGAAANGASIGGVVACNLSGPGRLAHGAARDHVLGVKGVSGRAESFKAGGRVVKNVTGYDVAKLTTGSYGTLAALTEITLKVLPASDISRTIAISDIGDEAALEFLRAVASSPAGPTGLAHVPPRGGSPARTLIRIDGVADSVDERAVAITDEAGGRPFQILDDGEAARAWHQVGSGDLVSADGPCLWRVSVAPSHGHRIVGAVGPRGYCYDWAGGLVWLAVDETDDGAADAVRAAVAGAGGGHATLVRGPETVRGRIPVFQVEDAARRALTRRIKDAFDPKRILNPGRMYEGV